MTKHFISPEQIEVFISMTAEVAGVLQTIQVKRNKTIMILNEWNQYSNMIEDVEDYIETLIALGDEIDDNILFESLPPIIQMLLVECVKFNELTEYILDGLEEASLKEGIDKFFIEGILDQMMMDVVSNEDWVIFDEILESFMHDNSDIDEESEEELLS
ncbi:hypothetical protein G7059_07680 [Erysipelothrix sp. HDW6A]|uniref:hypothetical protein n=1 Tax=Erysipelothrix sp. HDW6A TaxID=2714928 RepID=UPI001409C678|nr:hypothetical protein [Erysipelothrix sp. HDW6A]QIK57725.1 hypothetical protein G7059_07680 [Erysipelothrix sp. HDW6A]